MINALLHIYFDCNIFFVFRHNHSGTFSGRQLGEAAHRLVVNSLQAKGDYNGYGTQMHAGAPSYAGRPHYPPPYSNANTHIYFDEEYQRAAPSLTVHSPQGQQHRPSNYNSTQSLNDGMYNEYQPSTAARHPSHYRSQSPHYGRNNRDRAASFHRGGERSNNVQYQSGIHQDAGPMYSHSHRPAAQMPPPGVGSHPYGGGYNTNNQYHQNYQPSGAAGHQWRGGRGGGGWVPQHSQSGGRGYGRPHQPSGNQYSALDRRSNRPPPPGYGH